MKKLLIWTFALFCFVPSLWAGSVNYTFAQRDTCSLTLDLYRPSAPSRNITVLYVFGGGFTEGSRLQAANVEFFNTLAARGYTVAAIDYRLGLKGETKVGVFHPKAAFRAVDMAVEDLVSATKYLIDNSTELDIDPARIVLVGSSAGAITVLGADHALTNRTPVVADLPASFRYAGVVSMAGALFSTTGQPKYLNVPAPTMFFHGTEDNVVVYKKIQLCKLGMFGTDALVQIFDKSGYAYLAYRYEGNKHDVAAFPRQYNIDQICDFIDSAADKTFNNQIDMTVRDRYVQRTYKSELKRKDLYNGN
ncbi:MAG: alpha/beta hydrolase fold domain-containing protein [Mucinivorans sp.]